MALYRPDYKLREAKKIIDEINSTPIEDLSPRDELIKYFIDDQVKTYNKQNKRLNEYGDLFRAFNKLLPNNNRHKLA